MNEYGRNRGPRKRLAVLTTHPVQYNAPAFRMLAKDSTLDLRVFYELPPSEKTIDVEFGRRVEWDIPLLDGYEYEFLPNVALNPGTHHLRGINNPTAVEEIRRWAPDALLVYGWSFLTHLRVLRAFHGRIPILFRGDSTLLDEKPGMARFARRVFLRWVYRHVDIALYVGQHNRAYYRALGLRDDQLIWAPHAVDNERFAAGGREADEGALQWRRSLGITDDAVVFLFPAKLSSRKDPKTLLRAFIELRRLAINRPIHLIFAGDGELASALRTASAETPAVHFIGFQNQTRMPMVYRMSSVIVLPSRYGESWGLVVNEAMACGRAAIVSDRVGCAPDLIQPGRSGLIFQHAQVANLVDSMRRFADDPALSSTMGEEAARIIQDWSLSSYTATVEQALRGQSTRSDTAFGLASR